MEKVKFKQLTLEDPFFTSLKEDYEGFEDWFHRKNEYEAYIQRKDDGNLEALLYLKIEEGIVTDIEPNLPDGKHLKVGTFKIEAHNTKLGEYFIQMIMRMAIFEQVNDIYVTIFEKHRGLVNLLKRYGFEKYGTKGKPENPESVYVKPIPSKCDDLCKCFPFIHTKGKNKYMLSIYPKYHTPLFPDSILNTEQRERDELIKDVSHTNSIHKIYLCKMDNVAQLRPGDILIIYRTKDGSGPAYYKSVATSICVVEEIKKPCDFENLDEFINYTNYYSIFDKKTLSEFYNVRKTVVIKMTYNAAFNHRIINKELVEEVKLNPEYWGFFKLDDEQFNDIINRGKIDDSLIID